MSLSNTSFKSTGMRGNNLNMNSTIRSQQSANDPKNITQNHKSTSSDEEDSFILPVIRNSHSNFSSKNSIKVAQRPTIKRIKPNITPKYKKENISNIQTNKKPSSISSVILFDDSDSIQSNRIVQNHNSNRSNTTLTNNATKNRTTSPVKKNKEGNLRKHDLNSRSHLASDSSSDSLRINKKDIDYKNVKIKSDTSSSKDFERYKYTIDTVIESDNSDDIPFIDVASTKPEIDFKSSLNKNQETKNNSTYKNMTQDRETIEKVESSIKKVLSENSVELQKKRSSESTHHRKKSHEQENVHYQAQPETINLIVDNNEIQKTSSHRHKHRSTNRSKSQIEIKYQEDEKEKDTEKADIEKVTEKVDNNIVNEQNVNEIDIAKNEIIKNKNENTNINNNVIEEGNKIDVTEKVEQSELHHHNESSHSNSQFEILLDENIENDENLIQPSQEEIDYEKGITDPNEIKRLCTHFMKRRPGHKITTDLIPYKMHTDTKISFHGKKAKFTLFRGEVPLLSAKLKNKNGSDPIVNIFKFIQKEKTKSKDKSKSKNQTKMSPIAIVYAGSGFTTFTLRKADTKTDTKIENEAENAETTVSSPGKEIMTVKYHIPRAECAPRRVEVHLEDPPESIPHELTNRKPKFTYGSTYILDIGGRVAKPSIKNCVIVDENNNDVMSVMKIKDSDVSIEALPAIGIVTVFGFGISSVLCKL